MRVVINALSLKPQMGGGLTFGLNLGRMLTASAGREQVILLGGQHNESMLRETGCGVVSMGSGLEHPLRRIIAERTRIPRELRTLNADIFISLDGTIPDHLPCKSVAILQNLLYFHLSKTLMRQVMPLGRYAYARLQALYFLRSWAQTARRADCCLCVSETTRKEFVHHYPAMGSKAHVILEALDPSFVPGVGPDLGRPYILGVGTLYPNKRFDVLIDLLSLLNDVKDLHLKIAGRDWGGQLDRLRAHAQLRGVAERVEFLGHCEHQAMVPLYQRALAVGLFSETEAHPIPVAESLTCGTPVIVADRSGMAELGGPSALRIAVSELGEASLFVRRLLDDPDFRRHRSQMARASAERFHADRIAREYWSLFARVAGPAASERAVDSTFPCVNDRLEATYRWLPVPVQTAAVNWAGLWNRRARLGREFAEELRFLEQSEQYSKDELHAVQRERLHKLLCTAYEQVPFYRSLFRELHLTPVDFLEPADLAKLPVLEKSTVMARGAHMVNEALPHRARFAGRTSGSTGASLRLVHDAAALASEFATVWRLRRRFGCDLNRWHGTFAGRMFVPMRQTRPPYHRINYVQKQVLFSLYHLNAETVPYYVKAMSDRAYEYYTGYPSALEALILAGEEAGILAPAPIKALFTSSESLLVWQKNRLESSFGVPVYDRYGCAEFCVSFSVCEAGRYHQDSEFCIVEWEPLAEDDISVTGALICTGLMNHAMPFIRYRVGDVATIAKTPCPCGRASLSAFAIDGRREDFVVTKDGVRLGRLDHLFKDIHRIRESQIIQERPGRIKIRIVRSPEYTSADERRLLAECEKRMGDHMEVELEYISGIPRNTAGKFRAVINTMTEQQRYAH